MRRCRIKRIGTMLEKRTMWVNWKNSPQDDPYTTTVLIDSESKEVQFYGEDDLYQPNGLQVFYDTKEEAEAGREQIKHELMDKMPEVKAYLDIMDDVCQDEDENSFFRFKLKDFLGNFAWKIERYNRCRYTEKDYSELDMLVDLLTDYIHTGFLTIRADSFRAEDVERIKWGSKRAEIVLKGGKSVETCNESERIFIQKLFGHKYSRYSYTQLDEDEKE